jgi:hypothetical protein
MRWVILHKATRTIRSEGDVWWEGRGSGIVGDGELVEDSSEQRVSTQSIYLLVSLGKEAREDLARVGK